MDIKIGEKEISSVEKERKMPLIDPKLRLKIDEIRNRFHEFYLFCRQYLVNLLCLKLILSSGPGMGIPRYLSYLLLFRLF